MTTIGHGLAGLSLVSGARADTKTRYLGGSDEEYRALDEHRSATLLTLLTFVWGAISIPLVPWHPFWIPNLAQVVVCAPLLVYLLCRWTRPDRYVAELISATLVVYALLLLPWVTVMWCRLGRPLEAFTLPQLGMLCMALVFAGRWWRTVAAMSLFAAESVFSLIYAHQVGLAAQIPITEPLGTYGFAVLAAGLFALRWRRRDLAKRYVRVQSEIEALGTINPLAARARDELGAQLDIISAEIAQIRARTDLPSRAIGRALGQLGELHGKLIGLSTSETAVPSPTETERRLLDHDAQLGATFFVGTLLVIAIPATAWAQFRIDTVSAAWLAFGGLCGVVMLIYLVVTRRRPSSGRALFAVLVMFVIASIVITNDQWRLAQLGRPYMPFLGHELLMVTLGLTLATRFKLGVALIAVTAANALALWFVLGLEARRDIIPLAEPWLVLIVMLVGLVSLRMLEQRQIASFQLLRARSTALAMQRQTAMFLALRDRLNSPLQTLVLGAGGASASLPNGDVARMRAAIERLVELSRELARIDVHGADADLSLDTARELRRQPVELTEHAGPSRRGGRAPSPAPAGGRRRPARSP